MAFKWKFNIISGDWEWIDEETNYSLDQNGYAYSLPEFNKEDKDDEDDDYFFDEDDENDFPLFEADMIEGKDYSGYYDEDVLDEDISDLIDDEDDFSFPGFESLIYENDDSGLDTYYDDDD